MAAFLNSLSGRWEELPLLMPLEGQKRHFRHLLSFNYLICCFMVLMWETWGKVAGKLLNGDHVKFMANSYFKLLR